MPFEVRAGGQGYCRHELFINVFKRESTKNLITRPFPVSEKVIMARDGQQASKFRQGKLLNEQNGRFVSCEESKLGI